MIAVCQSTSCSIWPIPTAEEPSRTDDAAHEYSCIQEPIIPHIVVTTTSVQINVNNQYDLEYICMVVVAT